MPSTNPTVSYISTTNHNTSSKEKIYDATVVANYDDPGLLEDYFADILSQYVICAIESSNRSLTSDRWKNILVVVKRPPQLWISYQNGIFVNNPTAQSRSDANGNVNTGPASAYTVNNISPINYPYKLGENIKVKLIEDVADYAVANQSLLFQSACSGAIYTPSTSYYGSWHNQGLNSNPYIQQNNNPPALNIKTINPVANFPTDNTAANNNPFLYNIMINKIQYEAFILNQYPQFAAGLVSLFQGNSSYPYYYQGNGGYAFYNNYILYLQNALYEDMNVGLKQRVPNVSCLPLVVTVPSTFTMPAVRSPSTISYSPTYIQQS